jgi:hypothetical protein
MQSAVARTVLAARSISDPTLILIGPASQVEVARPKNGPASWRTDPDAIAMERVRDGDMEAFQILFTKYSGAIVKFAYRFLGSRDRAEEVAQTAFLQLSSLSGSKALQGKGPIRDVPLSDRRQSMSERATEVRLFGQDRIPRHNGRIGIGQLFISRSAARQRLSRPCAAPRMSRSRNRSEEALETPAAESTHGGPALPRRRVLLSGGCRKPRHVGECRQEPDLPRHRDSAA